MRLGVFDSGIGGQAIANYLAKQFPAAIIQTVNDQKNVPYGNKTPQEIVQLTETAIQPLLDSSCDIIIIACNTATAVAIDYLRQTYPEQKFIGLEPMVKTAASKTKTGIVTICATPATLASQRYQSLKDRYTTGLEVIEPDCSNWAYMIEHSKINIQQISETIENCCQQNSDIIVLACTHYHWIKELIIKITSGRAAVIDPSEAITNQVKNLLQLS